MKTFNLLLVCAVMTLAAQNSYAMRVQCWSSVYIANSSVTQNGAAYDYNFSLAGIDSNCPADVENLSDFYVPYFSDAGVTNIHAASGWSYAIENSDAIFNLGNGAEQLHFFANSPANYIGAPAVDGFGYTAAYDGVKAPYYEQLVYLNGAVDGQLGDPLIPGSPEAIDALEPGANVPEPASTALALIGFAGLVAGRRKFSRFVS